MNKCFCGLVHDNYQDDKEALLSDAYHDIFQGAFPGKEWKDAVFDLLIKCPSCHGTGVPVWHEISTDECTCGGTGLRETMEAR